MNKYLMMVLGAVALAGLGYSFGRYVQPAQVQIKTQVQIKEVEVARKNVVTVTHEEKKPDGTMIIDTRIEDKSTETTKTDTKEKTTETITNLKPQWKVQGLAGISLDKSFVGEVYGVGVERRIIGPIFVGVYGKTSKEVGLSLSVEF